MNTRWCTIYGTDIPPDHECISGVCKTEPDTARLYRYEMEGDSR